MKKSNELRDLEDEYIAHKIVLCACHVIGVGLIIMVAFFANSPMAVAWALAALAFANGTSNVYDGYVEAKEKLYDGKNNH